MFVMVDVGVSVGVMVDVSVGTIVSVGTGVSVGTVVGVGASAVWRSNSSPLSLVAVASNSSCEAPHAVDNIIAVITTRLDKLKFLVNLSFICFSP